MAVKTTAPARPDRTDGYRYAVTAADGTVWECDGRDLGALLAVLPGWRGFRRVA